MNNAMFLSLNLDLPSRRGRPGDREDGNDSNDSNWTSRGMRKSGRYYDEVDNGIEIAYFLHAHQEHDDLAE